MKANQIQRALRALYPSPPAPPEAARHELEAKLGEAFEARAPHAAATRRVSPRLAWSTALVVAVMGMALQAPAEYAVELGKHITIEGPAPLPAPQQLLERIERDAGRRIEVGVHVFRKGANEHLELDAWEEHLPSDAELEARLRAVPGLAGARIEVKPLRGRVRGPMLEKLGWKLFRRGATAEERARARAELIAEIQRTEGPGAQVDVQTQDDEGGHKVQVRVIKPAP